MLPLNFLVFLRTVLKTFILVFLRTVLKTFNSGFFVVMLGEARPPVQCLMLVSTAGCSKPLDTGGVYDQGRYLRLQLS